MTDNKMNDLFDQLSLPYLKFLAQRGNPNAQCNLATELLSSGDASAAAAWYRLAAQQGETLAQYNLGCLLMEGRGVEEDYVEAQKWFAEAAKQDYTNAFYNLGYMYEKGLGCKPDRARAVSYYQESARRGDEDSKQKLRELGVL